MRRVMLLLALAAAQPAVAQSVVSSPAPDRVAVTVYRDLNRGNAALDTRWLGGYALISETRRVSLPAGASDLRFEGVAGGIIPQSAIVSGLPQGVVERNRDAYLLSPGTLLDRSVGRRVQLRRTSKATGKVTEQEAVIRSGADGAVVLQTPAGVEALRCAGAAETLVYPEVPRELSAKPTLSVRVRSTAPVEAIVTLSYLASGFDWQANYVATLSKDETRLDLAAWLTLANGDETGFADANTQAVAGRLNRERADVPEPEVRPLSLQCWPAGTTSDIPEEASARWVGVPPPPPPPPPPSPERGGGEDIVVTGSRIMQAQRERLGDLQLYRIPEPVTVAANSQKQVALLEQNAVKVSSLYLQAVPVRESGWDQPATRVLRTRNRPQEGLGLPLPAGRIVLFSTHEARPLLLGEGALDDRTVGEEVEIRVGEAPGVRTRVTQEVGGGAGYTLQVTNDRLIPVRFEAELLTEPGQITARQQLSRRNGRPLWTVTVPANGTATLRYTLRD